LRYYIAVLRKYRSLQALLIILAAVVVFDSMFYVLRAAPGSAGMDEQQAAIRDKEKGIKAKEDELKTYLSFDSGKSDIARFRELLPRRSEYTDIIRRMSRLATDDGMKSGSFGADAKTSDKAGDLAQITFSLPVSGSYEDTRKFIHDVETSPLFLNINNLGLSSVQESDDITLTIGLSTYVRD